MVRDSPAGRGASDDGKRPPGAKVFAQFAEAWKPLDPQVAFVLSVIYSRAIELGIKPLNEMSRPRRAKSSS